MWSYILASVVTGYELWALSKVNLATFRAGAGLGTGFWALSTILETSIPAWAIAFLTSQQVEAAYRPLASPAVLVFFIFIILSTLRLSPWIAVLSGMVASISYLCAAWYLGWRIPLPGAQALFTQTTVTLNAITLLFGGVVAGAVATQIRRHVHAALQEAETKRKLETLEHDLQVARSIQQSLLPQERPQIDGFDIAGWNQPADDTGGDFFDWQTYSARWKTGREPSRCHRSIRHWPSVACSTVPRVCAAQAASASPKIFPMLSNTFTGHSHQISRRAAS